MSELIQKNENRDCRWQLLAGASALALMGYAAAIQAARAEDGDRPTVWIELGGQLSRWENSQEPYTPPFAALTPSNLSPPQAFQKPPRYGADESVALTVQSEGSEWKFSASVRYGRSGNSKHAHQQSSPASASSYLIVSTSDFHLTNHTQVAPIAPRFTDVVAKQSESHVVLDFQAGKDVGLGLFGHNASSSLDLGVRFAQFTSKSQVDVNENPDWHFSAYSYTYNAYGLYEKERFLRQPFHNYAGTFQATRSFSGLGPSISWNSSEPVIGNSEHGELSFDWGVNASLLFGRQKTKVHHQTSATYHSSNLYGTHYIHGPYQGAPVDHTRSRGVVVPNVGGFAGFSVKYPNAKVSFGYKADFFFGAMDGGNDVRRTEDIGFHGPFASVSIELGG
jgi:hypothetical protein